MTTTPNREVAPRAVVERMYAAFGAKDEAVLRDVIDADVVWNQCEGFPGGARRRGIDDVLSGVLAGNNARWTGFAVEVDELLESGDRVVVLGHYAGTHAETGKSMRVVFAHVYRIRDGRIVQFDQVTDTWPMVAAATMP